MSMSIYYVRNLHLLPAATKLGQGNIFTSMCQEFCPRGGGRVCASVHAGIHTPPDQADTPWTRQTPPPDQADTHPPPGPGRPPLGPGRPPREADSSIRSTSGRYASYWNAFLLNLRSKKLTSCPVQNIWSREPFHFQRPLSNKRPFLNERHLLLLSVNLTLSAVIWCLPQFED